MRTAVTLFSGREAALYFDRIVPLSFWVDFVWLNSSIEDASIFPVEILQILPENLHQNVHITRLIDLNDSGYQIFMAIFKYGAYQKKSGIYRLDFDNLTRSLGIQEVKSLIENYLENCSAFIEDFGFQSLPIDAADIFLDDTEGPCDTLIKLTNLRLIDTSRVSWQHILEFRADVEALARLRRLRSFAEEELAGKTPDQLSDLLFTRIYEYEETAKAWGFETKKAAVVSLLGSKVLAATLSGSLAAFLVGEPVAAAVSACGGIAVELGKIGLEIKQRGFGFRKIVRANPVSYISYAKASF